MNGKLKKIGLRLSGLLCAGMLFTCVLPAKANVVLPCPHIAYALIGWGEEVAGDLKPDEDGHYIRRGDQGCCATCGETFFINPSIAKEGHDFIIYNLSQNIIMKYCSVCEEIYFVIYT